MNVMVIVTISKAQVDLTLIHSAGHHNNKHLGDILQQRREQVHDLLKLHQCHYGVSATEDENVSCHKRSALSFRTF